MAEPMFPPTQRPRGKQDKSRGQIVEGAEQISESLVNWFLREQPPVDKAVVIPGSLKYIDPVNKVAKASVRTVWQVRNTIKEHVSLIRFKHDSQFRLIPRTLYFA
jgi:hypothetical protein